MDKKTRTHFEKWSVIFSRLLKFLLDFLSSNDAVSIPRNWISCPELTDRGLSDSVRIFVVSCLLLMMGKISNYLFSHGKVTKEGKSLPRR